MNQQIKNLATTKFSTLNTSSLLMWILISIITIPSSAQVVLNANGPGNTYERITNSFAPGNGVGAVEAPDVFHVWSAGRHIAEVFDADLNKYVFEFYSHALLDNEPVDPTLTDRQRVEIKTYAASPDNLKGTLGETVVYNWRFKLPIGFQPSANFTHIHQVKAVDGDDSNPIFTLTPRKGTPNKLELIYVKDSISGTDKKMIVNLAPFEGIWVEATETIFIGLHGTYSISLNKVSDNSVLLAYSNSDIATIRLGQIDNSFIRPKWGIYRSLLDLPSLRDEAVRFTDFSINEINTMSTNDFNVNIDNDSVFTNPINDKLMLSESILSKYKGLFIYDSTGKKVYATSNFLNNLDLSELKTGLYFVQFSNDNTKSNYFKLIKK
jgi:hypothetical protein